MSVDEIKRLLKLEPHPLEGGFFAETYRSVETLEDPRYPGPRSFGTAIYYLLTPGTYSALHRLASDEIFHFYMGDPVEMLQLWPDGTGRMLRMGAEVSQDVQPQVIVPRGVWQGTRLVPGGTFALLGTTVAPGFDAADYEHGDGAALRERYPEYADAIQSLTR